MNNITTEIVDPLIAHYLRQDAILPPHLYYSPCPIARNNPRHILLLGATGQVGPYLLANLLAVTRADIYCLVRPQHGDIKNYLLQTLNKYQLADIDIERIKPVAGNLALPHYGLPDSVYEELALKIDSIYHNAVWSNHVRPYTWPHPPEQTDIRATNTLSVRTTLEFAALQQPKHLNFTSTIAAINRLNFNHELTEDLPAPHNGLDGVLGGYLQSKIVAEKLIQQAIQRGLSARVYRLGFVSGHSETGMMFAQKDHMMAQIKTCIQLGYAPDWPDSRSFIPVDLAAAQMVAIATATEAECCGYNIYNPLLISWLDIITLLNRCGHKIKILSELDWIKYCTQTLNDSHALYPFRSIYLNPQGGGLHLMGPVIKYMFSGKVSCLKTLQLLEKNQHNACFPPSSLLLERCFAYFKKIKFI